MNLKKRGKDMLKSTMFSIATILMMILVGCSSPPITITSENNFSWVNHQCPIVASPDDPQSKGTSAAYAWFVGSKVIDGIGGVHSTDFVSDNDNITRLANTMSQFASMEKSEGGAVIVLDQASGGQALDWNMREYDNQTFSFVFLRYTPGSGQSKMYFRLLRHELGSTPYYADDGAVVGKNPIYQYELWFCWGPDE
jgi:hypothetical protein